jgi:hypothetical protein
MDLHFAELQGSPRPRCPFGLSIIGEILSPVFRSFRVLVASLKQQREIEYRINIGRRGSFPSPAFGERRHRRLARRRVAVRRRVQPRYCHGPRRLPS